MREPQDLTGVLLLCNAFVTTLRSIASNFVKQFDGPEMVGDDAVQKFCCDGRILLTRHFARSTAKSTGCGDAKIVEVRFDLSHLPPHAIPLVQGVDKPHVDPRTP